MDSQEISIGSKPIGVKTQLNQLHNFVTSDPNGVTVNSQGCEPLGANATRRHEPHRSRRNIIAMNPR
jgi:hypothetical protein